MDVSSPVMDSTTTRQPSRAEQDYLKAIHKLGGAEKTVLPVQIAALLRVRAPSVTGMFKRLKQAGWLIYKRRGGARLTMEGIVEARRVIRRHGLLEVLLARVLGLDWSEVNTEADALEHAVSLRLEQAIANLLGDPPEDLFGHAIPTAQGALEARQFQPLAAFSPGQRVLIREVADDEPARLRHWREQGLVPGVELTILSYEPLDDVFRVQTGKTITFLGGASLSRLQGHEVEWQGNKRVG